jgi:hypothetical protein
METEPKTTKTPNKKSATVTETVEDTRVFYKVSAREYLTMLPPFNVTLFPGTSAVIAVDHRDEIPESYHTLLAITEINREEYDKEISNQGILGKK